MQSQYAETLITRYVRLVSVLLLVGLYLLYFWQLNELTVTVEGLEKERDFYFGKLRDIEVLCQEHESEEIQVVKQILDILYATEVGMVGIIYY